MIRLLSLFVATTVLPIAAQPPTIAIIGLRHSHVWGHIGKMIDGKPAKLVGVAETLPTQIEEAKKRGVPDSLFFSDYKKMLETTKPDIVWAFNENNHHLEVVEACAPRKIHVIFEKPLASTLHDAQRIRQLANTHGIYIMTNYQMAWWAANYTAKKVADSGDLGKVWRLRGIVGHGGPGGPTGLNKVFFDWLTDPVQNGGGALMDFGCYNALWSLWYLGKPESVYAHTNQLRPAEFPKVEDNATFILSYKNGVGLFEGSWDLPRSFQELEIFGRDASLNVANGKVEFRKGRTGPISAIPIDQLPPERSEPIAYMVDCIRNKRAPEGLVALDINVGVVEIIEALRQSIKTQKPVRLAH